MNTKKDLKALKAAFKIKPIREFIRSQMKDGSIPIKEVKK